MIFRNRFFSNEEYSKVDEILELERDEANGDLFDETYNEVHKEKVQKEKKEEENGDATGSTDDTSSGTDTTEGGDTGSEPSDTGDTPEGDNSNKSENTDTSGDDGKSSDGSSDGNSDVPDLNSYKEYHNEYLDLNMSKVPSRLGVISAEDCPVGQTYEVNFYPGTTYLDQVSMEELLDVHTEAISNAARGCYDIKYLLNVDRRNRYCSLEDMDEGILSKAAHGVGNVISGTASWVGGKLTYLKELGFEYGPIALKHVAKGVVFCLDKTLKGLYTGTQLLVKLVKDRIVAYKRSKELLDKAAKTLIELRQSLDGKKLVDPGPYQNEEVIKGIKINGTFDPLSNTKIAYAAMKNHYENLLKNVVACTKTISNIIAFVKSNKGKVPNKNDVFSTTMLTDFVKKEVDGYSTPEGLTSVVYKEILPGDTLIIAYVPLGQIDGSAVTKGGEELAELFKEAGITMGVDTKTATKNPGGKYITNYDELKELITLLTDMCHYGIVVQNKLESYIKIRDNIKSELKDYVGFLFKSQEQITVEQSLVEYISPNLALLDQIATKGTYHIDQYMKKYISICITYIDDNLKDGFRESNDQKTN